MSVDSRRYTDTGRRTDPDPGSLSVDPVLRLVALAMAAVILFMAMTWLLRLESTLPDIRAPRSNESSGVLSGYGLMSPGHHSIDTVDADIRGEWLVQEVGDSDWLATDDAGSRIRAAFYGTEVYLLARVGPEAGIAYVTVDNRPADLLLEDEIGTYTDLWANSASDRPILLASNLAHGEHLVEITASGEGEVAIAGFQAVAQTPFPWAFTLGYTGLIGGLFLVIRQLLSILSHDTSNSLRGTRFRATGEYR